MFTSYIKFILGFFLSRSSLKPCKLCFKYIFFVVVFCCCRTKKTLIARVLIFYIYIYIYRCSETLFFIFYLHFLLVMSYVSAIYLLFFLQKIKKIRKIHVYCVANIYIFIIIAFKAKKKRKKKLNEHFFSTKYVLNNLTERKTQLFDRIFYLSFRFFFAVSRAEFSFSPFFFSWGFWVVCLCVLF